jgi:diketogulonate reductase-like aldo/keto reductase
LANARIKPAVNQIELHPYFQRDSLVKFCQKHGICVTAHTPLGGGFTANAKLFGSLSCLEDPVIKVVVIPNRSSSVLNRTVVKVLCSYI